MPPGNGCHINLQLLVNIFKYIIDSNLKHSVAVYWTVLRSHLYVWWVPNLKRNNVPEIWVLPMFSCILPDLLIGKKSGWACFSFFVRRMGNGALRQEMCVEFMPGAYIAYHFLWTALVILSWMYYRIYIEKSLLRHSFKYH